MSSVTFFKTTGSNYIDTTINFSYLLLKNLVKSLLHPNAIELYTKCLQNNSITTRGETIQWNKCYTFFPLINLTFSIVHCVCVLHIETASNVKQMNKNNSNIQLYCCSWLKSFTFTNHT